MSRVDEATKRHNSGYNCCQAVACAYADLVGIDEVTMYKVTEGFGLGGGAMNGICGAIQAASLLAGMLNSNGDIENPGKTKGSTYKLSAELQREFESRAKRLICRDIKTGNNGGPFTSCPDCVRIAAEIVEEKLFKETE